MTDVTLIGARTPKDLKSFHHQLTRYFDPRMISSLKNESIQVSKCSNPYFYIITEAIIIASGTSGYYLNQIGRNFIAHCRTRGEIIFSCMRIGHKESEDEVLERLWRKNEIASIEVILKGTQIEHGVIYR